MPEWEGGIAPSPDSPESSFVPGATAACRGGMKIPSSLEWGLLVAATVLNGILAGGSLIKSVVELPARRIIGLPAMAAFHRAADLRTGFLIYPALGLGAPAVHGRSPQTQGRIDQKAGPEVGGPMEGRHGGQADYSAS